MIEMTIDDELVFWGFTILSSATDSIVLHFLALIALQSLISFVMKFLLLYGSIQEP